MQIRKLHLSLMLTGAAILWLEPQARGTWHAAVSWANPAFQCGAISRRGFGGLMAQPRRAPNGKRAWFLGAWQRPSVPCGEG